MSNAVGTAKPPRPLKSSRKRLFEAKSKLLPKARKRKPTIRKGIIKARFKKKRLLKLKRPFALKRKGMSLKKKRFLRSSKLRRRRRRLPKVVTVPPQVHPQPHAEPDDAPNPSLQPGVNLIGYIRTEIGLGEACRLMAKAFNAAGLPFGILNFADPGARMARNEDMTWAHKETDQAPFKVNFFHMNANNLRAAYDYPFHPIGREVFHHRFNIGYWAWELAEFPDEWCNSFELVNEVWAPSQFIKDAVQQKSPHPVVKVPHAVNVRNADSYDRRAFGLPDGQFLFLSMYDTHSLKERKNPQAVIQAFKKAFPPKDLSVGLVIKVNNPNSNPGDIESLKQQTAGYSNIYMIHEILSRDKVDTLINSTDCFVSLHRSEGFGLVMAEAMFLGKPVIGTNWSGNTDFMKEGNSCPVNYNLVPVGQDIGPYKAHQLWADPDIGHAAQYMRRLVQDPGWRQSIAHNGKHTIHSEYSPHVVGQIVKNRLLELGLL